MKTLGQRRIQAKLADLRERRRHVAAAIEALRRLQEIRKGPPLCEIDRPVTAYILANNAH